MKMNNVQILIIKYIKSILSKPYIKLYDNDKLYKDLNLYGDDMEELVFKLSVKLKFKESEFWNY